MSGIDLTGKTVLITGGTMGIGLASALKFGASGAQTILTHLWGSADEDEITEKFSRVNAKPPVIHEADVSNKEDTELLMKEIGKNYEVIDIFISNVAFAQRIGELADYSQRALNSSIGYTAWPMWAYTEAIHKQFGKYPSYVIGLSSDGPDSFFAHYDFVAMAKSVLETMCRYMNYRLSSHGVKVNIVRSRMVPTDSFNATFGESFHDFVKELHFDDCYVSTEEVASVVLALSSGLLDAVAGQVIMADRGFSFFDNLMGAYVRSKHFSME